MNYIKNNILVVIFISMFLIFTACSNDTQIEDSSENGDDNITIGVSLLGTSNENIVELQEGIEEKADELNVNVRVTDANGDASEQLKQVENFIVEGVDAILLNPVETEASSPATQAALDANIPIVNVNAETDIPADAFVGSDDKESAEIAINYIAEQLDEEGDIVMIQGNPGQSAEILRGTGAKETLENYPNMNLLKEQPAKWSREEALTLTQNWLQSSEDFEAVFAQNDEMAMGALSAIENANKKDDIILIGVDAIPDALNSIAEGRLDATVYQNSAGQGAEGLEIALKIINGEDYEEEVLIPFELVTKENVDEYLK